MHPLHPAAEPAFPPFMRCAPLAGDQRLTAATRRWLRHLPPGRRPLRLCAAHPRVANRIAWCWDDPELREAVLLDLLVDRRGGRTGFGATIVRELLRLRECHAVALPARPASRQRFH
jgi:hypothetical protein